MCHLIVVLMTKRKIKSEKKKKQSEIVWLIRLDIIMGIKVDWVIADLLESSPRDEGTSVTTLPSWTAVTVQPMVKEMAARTVQTPLHPEMKRDGGMSVIHSHLVRGDLLKTVKNSGLRQRFHLYLIYERTKHSILEICVQNSVAKQQKMAKRAITLISPPFFI